MNARPLSPDELASLQKVFSGHTDIDEVALFGSRAKGSHSPHSDVDLSIRGELDELQIEEIASELDDLSLPYRFDVLLFNSITNVPLKEHIDRVGLTIYSARNPSLSISRVLPT